MTPPTIADLARSVQDRLKNEASRTGRPFIELLELYAVERFLHRLGRSSLRDEFVLKGAQLLRAWLGTATRPTKDIDLLGPANLDAESLRRAIEEILGVEVEDDAIDFQENTIVVRPIRIGSSVLGFRVKFDASMARTRLRYQIDIGLGDSVYPPPVDTTTTGLLGLSVESVRAYTPYTVVAEKLEALVVHGEANSRTKDYYDLLELPRALPFDGATLLESIRRTFSRRATAIPELPLDGLRDDYVRNRLQATRWEAFLAKGQLRAEPDFLAVVRDIRRFVDPALDAARKGASFPRTWPAGGPWR